jgi:hypothetical protein
MDTSNSWMIFATIGFFPVLANLLLMKDVFEYFPFKRERLFLNILIWAIPFAGAFYVFRKIGLEHYKTGDSSTSAVSVGLLGMDEIFNPGAKQKYSIEKVIEDKTGIDEVGIVADTKPAPPQHP